MATAPIVDTLFNEAYDMETRCDSIGSNDAVIIINPTMYTIQYDDFDYNMVGGERSAFDPDTIVDETEEEEQKKEMKELQEMKHLMKIGET